MAATLISLFTATSSLRCKFPTHPPLSPLSFGSVSAQPHPSQLRDTAMAATLTSLFTATSSLRCESKRTLLSHHSSLPSPKPTKPLFGTETRIRSPKPRNHCTARDPKMVVGLIGAGLALTLAGPAGAAELPFLGSSLQLTEPANALSLPTWAIHVSSVAEWITAMFLVWRYGEECGIESWKGLAWGMVPALGGAFCACTWHFFYNAESLQVLVALQGGLTVIGNTTMCIAAYRIYKSSVERTKEL